jgi:NADH:ubiquinone oxidoreductase subunit
MSFINKFWIKFFAREIGADQFGNKYFIGKNKNYLGHSKRFVVYDGKSESSKVPPMWHAWLHYLNNEIPDGNESYSWQQEHIPNLTGTKHAYNPDKAKNKKLETYSTWIPNK